MSDLSFACLNTGTPTCLHASTGTYSCIDLSFVSTDALLDFSWDVLLDDFGSDHYPVRLTPIQPSPQTNVTMERWLLPRADWNLFSYHTQISRSVGEFSSTTKCLEHLEQIISTAASKSIPRTSKINKPHRTHWWTPDCTKAIKEKKRASRRFYRTRLPANRIEMRRKKAIARRTLKLASRDSWRSFVSTISSSTPSTVVWNKVRSIERKRPPTRSPVLQINNNFIFDQKEVADHLAASFAEVSRSKTTTLGHGVSFPRTGNEPYNRLFSMRELQSALAPRRSSAPGPDSIPYPMLQHLHPTALHFLLDLYNRIWIEGDFPPRWSEATIIPIPKPGKNPLDPSNYRPIALTCTSCKTLEKMVATRLSDFMESRSIYPETQSGFRKFRSTIDPLLLLSHEIQEAFSRRSFVSSVFFDIQKAYDTSSRQRILEQFHKIGLKGALPIFIKNFLTNRSFRVRIGHTLSGILTQEEGVPQGSVLSVLCFSILMNTVTDFIPTNISRSLYADDLAIYFSGRDPAVVARQVQLAINKVVEWATSVGFTLSKTKTTSMTFYRGRKVAPPALHLQLQGQPLNNADTVRFLGMTFDTRLSWHEHVKKLKISASKSLNLMDHLSHLTWGADRCTLLRLYTSLVQSKLDYGCEVYNSAPAPTLRLLDPIHNRGLRLTSGAFKSSPISSLQVECNQPPLSLRREFLIIKSYLRSQRFPSSILASTVSKSINEESPWPYTTTITSFFSRHNVPLPPVLQFSYNIEPWILHPITFCRNLTALKKKSTSDVVSRKFFMEHTGQHSHAVPIYTDGSRSSKGVAAAAVILSDNPITRTSRLPNEASVFTAELTAILDGLSSIGNLPPGSFVMYVDSRSVLESIASFNPKHPLSRKIQQEYHHLISRGNVRVEFCWVPAHVGIPGNERADQAAKAACQLPAQVTPLHFEDYTPLIKSCIRSQWQNSWNGVPRANKLLSIKPQIGHWASSFHRARHKEVILARLRIGHTRITHDHLMAKKPPPQCAPCDTPLTVSHILSECPTYSVLRLRHFPRIHLTPPSERLQAILAESPSFSAEAIFSFLSASKLLPRI